MEKNLRIGRCCLHLHQFYYGFANGSLYGNKIGHICIGKDKEHVQLAACGYGFVQGIF